jgi:hypothetical protein
MDFVTHIMESAELDDEERLSQLKLMTVLSKLPIEKLKEVQAKFNAKLKSLPPELRVITGGKRDFRR